MGAADFSSYLVAFMIDTAVLAGTPLAVATVCGLAISIFQAVTQVQDQTLSQTVKIAAIAVVLLVFGASLTGPLVASTIQVFTDFPSLVR